MAAVTNRGADRAAALFQKGQKFYKAQQYDLAEKAFLKAMDMCNCGVSVQNQPRIDNDILLGIKKKDLKGALTKLSASQRCNSRLHLDMLDSIIATYEAQARLDEALEFSLKMVNLSPREPKSYLRLGKVLRLKNQQTTAYHNYKQGIELVKRKNPNHPLLSKLHAQKDKVLPLASFDPMTELPIELVGIIFRFLNTRTQCRCLCVSKTWKTVLTTKSLSDLWKVQEYTFTRLRQPSSPRIFASFASNWNYAGRSITELSVDGCAQFLKIGKLERLFRFFQDLKVLKLREPHAVLDLGALPETTKKPKLKSVYLGHGVQPSHRLLRQLLESSSASLEELSVFRFPKNEHEHWLRDWPKLEKLKVIRLLGSNVIDALSPTNISRLIELAPNLEEAWIDPFTWDLMPMMCGWRRLQSISVRIRMQFGGPNPFAHVHEQLREFHLEMPPGIRILGLLLDGTLPQDSRPYFQNMEKLSVLNSSKPPSGCMFEFFVRGGLESGTLREVHFDPLPASDFFGNSRVPTIPTWLRSDSVTYFSLTGFARDGLHEHRLLEDVVLEIASRFPNLSTVDVSNEPFPDTLLAKLIQRGVKTIYCRPALPKVDLSVWASRKFGAQIITGLPPHIPAYHPDQCRNTTALPYFDPSVF
ncbi:uncharacterized protein F4807DRAFT_435516 [Annulohypoxylon truncatum]|uniref:uncharacterized protein n=1 Tax=Annulohypoxylon truncatum TaxID=327061 RepID=UPI002007A899|nr:uncharacterized protein F4807DRAFT_435516 [Annulohypoxylon truncatum]KAI1207361.1 hypothetical protein F4807DRAFT_435516 [Annulohypoxylon truncatum]